MPVVKQQLQQRGLASTPPCSPSISTGSAVGGPAKSQLVHEVDALGGMIGLAADHSTDM